MPYHNKTSLHWRHNGRDSVSNHQPHDCLLNGLFGRRSKKTWKLRVIGLCMGNSPGTGEFPAQMASDAEIVSILWRHHDCKAWACTYVYIVTWKCLLHYTGHRWVPLTWLRHDINRSPLDSLYKIALIVLLLFLIWTSWVVDGLRRHNAHIMLLWWYFVLFQNYIQLKPTKFGSKVHRRKCCYQWTYRSILDWNVYTEQLIQFFFWSNCC